MAQRDQDCNKNIMAELNRFWRRTPPALFPSLLGLFGLALAWRKAAFVFDVPPVIGETIGLCATIILVVTLSSYVVKLMIRPTVLWDDLKISPARGSVSAGSMCAMALATYLLYYSAFGAFLIWWMSLGLHAVYFSCVLLMLIRHENCWDEVSPVIMLPAVGFLVATLAAPALGYTNFAYFVLALTFPVSAAILLLSLWNARKLGVPMPQRTSYAIFLAPPSVAALGAYELSGFDYFLPFWIGASLVALALLPFSRWMTAGGYSPAWGAFTFPLAAFAAVQLVAVQADYGLVAQVMAIVVLATASLLIPYVVFRTYVSWARGTLAEATKAAVA